MRGEELKQFFSEQLEDWPLACENFENLIKAEKKPFKVGDLKGYVQYNPGRSGSTLAKVDKDSIKKRECFLCERNRPQEQKKIEIIPGWELLVNPYPILPYHFTIVSQLHVDQKFLPQVGMELSRLLPGYIVFYNSDGAGASAPDHSHFQAVPFKELPLISFLEENWEAGVRNLELPYQVIISWKDERLKTNPLNAYFWQSKEGESRFCAILRKSHRPHQFFLNPPDRRAISPGAIDMAGLIVTPFEEDFKAVTSEEIGDIYKQVAW